MGSRVVPLDGVRMNRFRTMRSSRDSSDEELMRQVAAGSQEPLGALYRRYAPLIFNVAAQTLDRAAAEEIVQDAFLAVWRRAALFDPQRGTFRAWVLQIAHFRILNELRRRNRQPQLEPDPDGVRLAALPDRSPEPAEAAWREYRRSAVHAALDELPPPQREALGLALLRDLTHEQVAAELNLPLGTAKTRIRTGLQTLRGKLVPRAAALALVGVLALLGIRYRSEQVIRRRDDRALALLTTSDIESIRLAPAPGIPEETHGHYRGRPGADIAVLSLSSFPPAPAGQTYQGWVLRQGTWTSLGTAELDADGNARLIAEGPEVATAPEAIQVTREPAGGSPVPRGTVMIRWPAR